uniref:CLIP domain-containing serine protease n=2 Tax=Anoplophora glabripennis TaxID=217634 RepID=V5GX21_ANOGL
MEAAKSFLVVVQVLALLFLCCGEAGASCQTPRGGKGECKSISNCQALLALVQRRPIKPEDADYLRRSRCSSDEDIPKLCCPLEETSARSQLSAGGDTEDIDFCQTSRREQGACKSVSQCPTILSILRNKPIKAEDAEYLRRSNCGSDGSLPKMCCPFEVKPVSSNLLPSAEICGVGTPDKIYGGTEADLNEYPWMALIEYQDVDDGKRGFYCGGALISKRYVLTAAHCMKGDILKSWKLISVRLGEHNTDTNPDCTDIPGIKQFCTPSPVDVSVEERIVHEGYDPYDANQYHDIGLLRLSSDVQFTSSVKPICLPVTEYIQKTDLVGEKLVVAGWGKTENKSESSVKLKLAVPFKPNTDCVRSYGNAGVELANAQICAGGERGKDSCSGDSGGPLMRLFMDENKEFNWYVIGVVSFGPTRCGMDRWPGVYTKVDSYVQWITSKLKP